LTEGLLAAILHKKHGFFGFFALFAEGMRIF